MVYNNAVLLSHISFKCGVGCRLWITTRGGGGVGGRPEVVVLAVWYGLWVFPPDSRSSHGSQPRWCGICLGKVPLGLFSLPWTKHFWNSAGILGLLILGGAVGEACDLSATCESSARCMFGSDLWVCFSSAFLGEVLLPEALSETLWWSC